MSGASAAGGAELAVGSGAAVQAPSASTVAAPSAMAALESVEILLRPITMPPSLVRVVRFGSRDHRVPSPS